jgi:hypothetical protein
VRWRWILPEGTVVELPALQQWLKESTASGWKVGVSRVFPEQGVNGLVVKRQKRN